MMFFGINVLIIRNNLYICRIKISTRTFNTLKIMKKEDYLKPAIDVTMVAVEKGFASSAARDDFAAPGEAGQYREGKTYTF